MEPVVLRSFRKRSASPGKTLHPWNVVGMYGSTACWPFGAFKARRGLATPVSMLLILFSLTLVSTVAYSYSLSQIRGRKEDLKLVAAHEKMLDMDDAVSAVAWSPGSSRTLAFSDYGGQLRVEPGANHLQLNITAGNSTDTLFDSDTGHLVYELPSTIAGQYSSWLRGDRRAIVNQSSSYQVQMRIETGEEHKELTACYRPLVSSSVGDLIGGRRVNNIRICIINLNGSQSMQPGGEFNVKVVGDAVSSRLHSYDLNPSATAVVVRADLDGVVGTIEVPLTVGPAGSTARIEVVIGSVDVEAVRI